MKEILPGVFHWRVEWPGRFSLESFFLHGPDGSVLIDPMEYGGLSEIEAADDVAGIIITRGRHERSAHLFARRKGASVYVPEKEVASVETLDEYETYDHGDALPGGLKAIGVFRSEEGGQGEQALLSPLHGGTLIVGDCLGTTAYWAPGVIPLGAHPGGHPRSAESLSHLLDLQFDNLLPGHGDPILGGARSKLEEYLESSRRKNSQDS